MLKVIQDQIAAHDRAQKELIEYRDKVAFMVLDKMIGTTPCDLEEEHRAAKLAYRMADAMLAAREIKNEPARE